MQRFTPREERNYGRTSRGSCEARAAHPARVSGMEKGRLSGALLQCYETTVARQPFSALAARRERRVLFVSSVAVLLLAAAPLPPLVDPAVDPAPVLELAAPPDEVLAPEPMLPPLDVPDPGVVVPGLAAPISPALVPGPMRPALSESAGEPCAAYAPATAADMQPATTANMSFLITYLPKKVDAATPPHGRGHRAFSNCCARAVKSESGPLPLLFFRQRALDHAVHDIAPGLPLELPQVRIGPVVRELLFVPRRRPD
ncbi:MAG: hypothetical protein JWO70_3295 [Betaproteobacteria bacterium]|nr:hypothetical protein [Betaproteobacteria bacterium]